MRLFKARIVARDDNAIATIGRFLGHQGALTFISIAAGAADRNHLRLAAHNFINRREHVGQSIRRVSIVNYCTYAFWGANGFKAPVDGMERREYAQSLIGRYPKFDGCTIHGEQIRDIKTSDKPHTHLATINFEQHTFERLFKDLSFIIGRGSRGIRFDTSLCILHHNWPVLIVGVGDSKSVFTQTVKERLLSVAIILKSFMIVEVVARQVGEECAGEV